MKINNIRTFFKNNLNVYGGVDVIVCYEIEDHIEKKS
jgi:hypothetical protein